LFASRLSAQWKLLATLPGPLPLYTADVGHGHKGGVNGVGVDCNSVGCPDGQLALGTPGAVQVLKVPPLVGTGSGAAFFSTQPTSWLKMFVGAGPTPAAQ
jgi:hypothetical protein